MEGCIYKITNSKNKKVYVGKTKIGIERRWKCHVSAALGGHCLINRAIKKHGKENFQISLLESVDEQFLGDRERYWVKTLNTMMPAGYNMNPGGDGFTGKFTNEQRAKLSQSTKRSWKYIDRAPAIKATRSTEESRRKTSDAAKVMWNNPLFKKEAGERMKLSWKDPSTRIKHLEATIRKFCSEEDFEKARLRRTKPFECGHEMKIENVYLDSLGYLHCRICRNVAGRKRIEAGDTP